MLRQAGDAEQRHPALPRAQHFAAAPQSQVLFGDDESILGAAHDVQSLARRVRQRLAIEQDTRRLLCAASDPAAQLVQLRQPEALGMIDDHDGGVRHVDADLDHRGGDQDRQRAGGECRHDAILVLAGEFAMHQPDPLTEPRPQLGMPLLRGGDVQHLGLGNQRADPVDLRAGGERALDPFDHLVEPLERDATGCDRLPAGRLLVEPRHVHIAIAREQQRARDRRRRHHQQLGAAAGALLLQRQPLMHAEFVLLVDDDQAEILEDDMLLKQSMRADQNVDASALQRLDDLRALAAPLAPGEQRDAQAGGGTECADGLKMLPGEQLGRRHQRRLRSRLDRACHREQRDHGLAAADIALEETQHALRTRQIGVDLGQGADLRAGQREGQRGEDCLAELAGCSKPPAGTPLEPRADDGKRQLIGEQLVISEPRPGRRRRQQIGFGLGRVQARKCLGERRPRLLRQKRRVRPFRQRRQVLKRLADRLAQRRIGEARRSADRPARVTAAAARQAQRRPAWPHGRGAASVASRHTIRASRRSAAGFLLAAAA